MRKILIPVVILGVSLLLESSAAFARGGSVGCGNDCSWWMLIFPVALILYVLFSKK
jgi:hypothetical protein